MGCLIVALSAPIAGVLSALVGYVLYVVGLVLGWPLLWGFVVVVGACLSTAFTFPLCISVLTGHGFKGAAWWRN